MFFYIFIDSKFDILDLSEEKKILPSAVAQNLSKNGNETLSWCSSSRVFQARQKRAEGLIECKPIRAGQVLFYVVYYYAVLFEFATVLMKKLKKVLCFSITSFKRIFRRNMCSCNVYFSKTRNIQFSLRT